MHILGKHAKMSFGGGCGWMNVFSGRNVIGERKKVKRGTFEIFPSFIYSGIHAAVRFASYYIVLQEGDS